MAIVGAYPVLPQNPSDYQDPFIDSRSLGFRSIDGQTILPFTGDEFIAQWGLQGFDVPKRDLVEETTPGLDGSDLVDIKIASRPVFIPIFCGSNSGHLQYLRNRAQLRALFNHRTVDYRTNGGTFDIVASSVVGDRSLRVAYVDGMNGDYSQDSYGAWWESFGLSALSVRTYWYGDRWVTPRISRPAGFSFFGTFPPVLSSGRTLGADIPVTVGGDADSWPRIDMAGPAPLIEITGPGLYLAIPGGLADGETAVIDTDPRNRVALFNGVLDWTRVAPNRAFSAIPPGDNTFNLDLGDAGANAYAVVSGPSLWETPW